MAAGPVAVAYSGGRDSTALLDATLRAAAPLGIEVVALHVHHGLSAHADAWLAHCRDRCAELAQEGAALVFDWRRVAGRPARSESVEAWARQARYAALTSMAKEAGASLVLLGHHRRDQAETLLLQALRGAGVAGLAAMPRLAVRDGITWARPWLDTGDDEIRDYVLDHGLEHIVDDSNCDSRFDRNRLRVAVWPHLVKAFPNAETGLATAASWAHEASCAQGDLAALDLLVAAAGDGLDVEHWTRLSSLRRKNALRAWLKQTLPVPSPATLLARLCDELPRCRSARWPAAGGELRLHRGAMRWQPSPHSPPDLASFTTESLLRIGRAGTYRLPGWLGTLKATRAREGGVAVARLESLQLRARQGAERFQAGPGRPPRELKKQYQAAGIPAWQRDGPLVYSDGRLIFVPGLGIDARVVAAAGEPQLRLEWIPDSGRPASA